MHDGRGGQDNRGDNRGPGGGPGGGPGYNRGGPQYGGGGGGRVWRRGDRYDGPRSGMWQVQDWRRYRGLYAPPPGYYWVQYGNQFLLAALATGIIANVIANSYGAGGYGPGYGAGPMGPAPY
ncbi:RcnB family protein [Gluconacetobacter sp. Hr-1-5]|uniref:RcnB family protein n=1 Tax=Gluconacetobacter sp. Hr-1-5 TaxID=3395370 RepID=UPI003B525E47